MSRAEPAAGFFFMHDYDNHDPSAEDWAGHDVGSWMWWTWAQLNGSDGSYNWSLIDDYLTAAAALGKKVALSVQIYTEIGADSTPLWVYGKDPENTQKVGWPILDETSPGVYVPTGEGYFPKWNDALWEYYWWKFIDAFGAEFNGDSRIHSIWIANGLYGEAVTGGLGDAQHTPVVAWKHFIDHYNSAFPDTPIFTLSSGPTFRRPLTDYCALFENINPKMNVLAPDVKSHVIAGPHLNEERGSAEVALYATQTLGLWQGYEHGDIVGNVNAMYSAMLAGLATGMRVFDTDNGTSQLLSTLATVDTSATLGDFWDWCLEMMGYPLRHVAMWVGRDTVHTEYEDYDNTRGWIGPWIRAGIEVNASTYATDEAEYTAAPASLKGGMYDYVGLGYCSAGTLIATLSDMPDGTYDTTVIYAGTAGTPTWTVDTDTVTVTDGAGTLISVAGPCWVHLVTATLPGEVSGQVAPYAPVAPKCEGATNPTNVDTLTPTFSWTFSDANSGDAQSAYEVIVNSTYSGAALGGGDLWWTEKVVSTDASVVYDGTALTYGTKYYWRVRVYDDGDGFLVGPWCSVQEFTIQAETPETPTAGDAVRDHFRLGAGRVLEWLNPPILDSGYRATVPADPDDDGMALITSITVTEDATELVTRVYPQSAEGLTVELATSTPPTGYTVDTDEGYVEHDAGVATYGAIEQWKRFSDVSMTQDNSLIVLPELCANALVDRAVEYLRVRAQVNTYYNLEVICNGTLKVGTTIKVVYRGYSNDGTWLTIDDDLYITSVTTTIDEDGFRTTGLEVSTIDAERGDDASILARAIQATHRAPKVQRT